MKKVWEFISKASHSRTTAVLVILILFASVPLTVFVAQQRQQTQQHAEGPSICTGGGDYLYCSGSSICVEHGDCTYQCAACPNGGTCQGTGNYSACSSGVPTVTPTASVTPTTPPTTTTPIPSPGTLCPTDGVHKCMQSCPSGSTPNNAYSCTGVGYCCEGNGYACPGATNNSSNIDVTGAGSQYTCRSVSKGGCQSNEVNVSTAGNAICTIDYGQSAVCCTASSSSPVTPTTVAPTTINCTAGQSYCKNIGAPDTNCTLWNYVNCQACLPLLLVACTPAPTATIPVVSLSANPTSANAGSSVNLTWSATNSPISCTASNTGGVANWNTAGSSIPSSATLVQGGSQSITVNSTTTFSLSCTNSAGTSQIASTTVNVGSGTGNVALALTIGLDGVGNTGDRVTTLNNLSNKNPSSPRSFTVAILDINKTVVAGASATPSLSYDSASGKFKENVTIPTTVPEGTYTIGVNSAGHLRANAGTITVTSTTTTATPFSASTDLIAGDIDGSTIIDVMDYNILKSCSKFSTDNHGACGSFAQASDLNLDGQVDQLDYNLWAREFSVSTARQGY